MAMANSQNGGDEQYGTTEPLADYPDADVMLLEEALPLMNEGAIEVVSYTNFYDEFLNTDKLQQTGPIVESALGEYGVLCTLDLVEGKMKVSKTKGTQEEDIIFKAMDILELLSRSVPADWAIRIVDCSCEHEIIKIGNQEGGFCDIFGINEDRRKWFKEFEQFLARRKLLIGVLQGLFVLTGCGIFLKGNTIAVLGSLQGIKMITRIVEDCIAHDAPPAPRVRRLKKKIQPKKDGRIKMTSQVVMNLESLRV